MTKSSWSTFRQHCQGLRAVQFSLIIANNQSFSAAKEHGLVEFNGFYRLSHNLLNLLEGIASGNLNSGLVIYAVLCSR